MSTWAMVFTVLRISIKIADPAEILCCAVGSKCGRAAGAGPAHRVFFRMLWLTETNSSLSLKQPDDYVTLLYRSLNYRHIISFSLLCSLVVLDQWKAISLQRIQRKGQLATYIVQVLHFSIHIRTSTHVELESTISTTASTTTTAMSPKKHTHRDRYSTKSSSDSFQPNQQPKTTLTIDLHGYSKAEGISKLTSFLDQVVAQQYGQTHAGGVWVLVITGSGAHSSDGREWHKAYSAAFILHFPFRTVLFIYWRA